MKKPIVTALFLIFAFWGSSQDSVLTIEQAVQSAFVRNPELQQLRARLKQRTNLRKTESGISAPEVSYMKEGIGNGLFDEKRVSISQEMDFPLTTSYRLKGISEEIKAMENEVRFMEKEIKADVKISYAEVLYALYMLRLRQEEQNNAHDMYNAVFTKYETGMATGIDLANAELRLEEAKNDMDQSTWLLHKARYSLFYFMGLPENEQLYTISFTDTLLVSDLDFSEIQSLSSKGNQPLVLATQHEQKASEYYLKEARSNILPDLRVSLYKQNYGDGYNFRGFEVGLQIPLWYPLEQKGRINTATARQEEIEWKQQQVALDIKRQIESAWHNYSVSWSIINRYHETMKGKAEQLKNLTLRAYQLGEVDLLHLINAQQVYLASEQRYLGALRDYYIQLILLEKYLDQDLVY